MRGMRLELVAGLNRAGRGDRGAGGVPAGPPAAGQETPRPGGELVYSVLAEPPSFDAHQEATFAVPHSTAPFYSLLVKIDAASYPKVVPDLAESWTISPDGRVYEFKLRGGVKFHDGSPLLTARDVKASLDHVIFPPVGGDEPAPGRCTSRSRRWRPPARRPCGCGSSAPRQRC